METHVFRCGNNGRRYYWPSLFHLDPCTSATVPLFIIDVLKAPIARDFYLGSIPLAYANAILIGNHVVTSIEVGGRIVGEEMILSSDDESATTIILSIDDTSGHRSILRCRVPFGLYLAQGLQWGHTYGVIVVIKGHLLIRNRQLQGRALQVKDRNGDFSSELSIWNKTLKYRKDHLSVDWEVVVPDTTDIYKSSQDGKVKDSTVKDSAVLVISSDSEVEEEEIPISTGIEDSLYLPNRKRYDIIDTDSDSLTEVVGDSSDIEVIAINRQGPPRHILLAEIIRILILNKFVPILVPQLYKVHLRDKWGTFGGILEACQELYRHYNLIHISTRNKTISSTNLKNLYNNTANCLRRMKLAKMTFDEDRTFDVPKYIAEFPQFTLENWDFRIMNSLIDFIVMYDVGDKNRWVCGKFQWRFKG
ncbi:uncharacterized protein KQ657_003444 [Scheffersomyces spartinae]|uniref:CST complex subunit Stn1 N-terminal domain-containing protein n=1 Tax=Scheffersomyces spartinae TaxID=45513 RepID=A0A9P7V5A0_9ASCO|nr:uncharacterized protein KQ657_003444 [Scheffersomyces spartinae]KAG7191400.1 hypothetical protein KQ657_003444 [Scheffersomyces spartinae]